MREFPDSLFRIPTLREQTIHWILVLPLRHDLVAYCPITFDPKNQGYSLDVYSSGILHGHARSTHGPVSRIGTLGEQYLVFPVGFSCASEIDSPSGVAGF